MFEYRCIVAIGLSWLALAPTSALAATDCAELKAAALVHFQGPFTQEILTGATAAAEQCGASIQTQGPAAFDTQASLTQFNDVVAAGADVVSLVAYPGDFWVRPIDDAVRSGVTVSTYDSPSPASLVSLHVAPKQQALGSALADVISEAIGGQSTSGTVVAGLCIPGLDLLEQRVVGFKRQMADVAPNVEVLGAFDVSFDQTENLARWTDLVATNPGALAYVGFCENDLPSLVRIKERDPASTYKIGSIGINPEGLQGIKEGIALVAIGQKPFMMGYVSMKAMLEVRASGGEMPRGWIDIGPEIVTGENVIAVIDREKSLSKGADTTQAYYQPEIDEIFTDLPAAVQSFGAFLEP